MKKHQGDGEEGQVEEMGDIVGKEVDEWKGEQGLKVWRTRERPRWTGTGTVEP